MGRTNISELFPSFPKITYQKSFLPNIGKTLWINLNAPIVIG